MRHICLKCNGVRYIGMIAAHNKTIHSKKWAILATGSKNPLEKALSQNIVQSFHKAIGFNEPISIKYLI